MVWPILILVSVTPGAFSAAAGIAMAPLASKQANKIRNTARPLSPSMWPVAFKPWRNVRRRSHTAGFRALAASGHATSGHAAAAPPRRLMKSRGFIPSPRRRSERRVRKGRCPNHSGVPLAFAHETVLSGAVEFLALRAHRLRRARLPFTFFQEAVESGAGQWLAILVDCFARARFLRHCRADRQGRNHGSEDNSLHGTSSRWWTFLPLVNPSSIAKIAAPNSRNTSPDSADASASGPVASVPRHRRESTRSARLAHQHARAR